MLDEERDVEEEEAIVAVPKETEKKDGGGQGKR